MSKRVLIVGGGPSALSCAWHLKNLPEGPDTDITILQMGWRCGGKGASGRNAKDHQRIQEHGLHIMFGFYDNFFHMIEKAYADIDRPPDAPLATWQEAFLPGSSGTVMDFYEDVWYPISLEFPRNSAIAGQGTPVNDSRAYFGLLLGAAIEVAFGWQAVQDLNDILFGEGDHEGLIPPNPDTGTIDELMVHVMKVLQTVLTLGYDVSQLLEKRAPLIVKLLQGLRDLVNGWLEKLADHGHKAHLLVEGIEFVAAFAEGIVTDGVLLRDGFAAIDNVDFADWLVSHGMNPDYKDSVAVMFIYDAAFSFKKGDGDRPLIAAGVTVRTLLRLGLTYKGAAYYKMAAGMGDVIIAPLYQTLKKSGVKFGFFQKVEEVVPHPEQDTIERVRVRIQATPKGGPFGYDPLVDVKGLPCWPSAPIDDRIEDPASIAGIDLESYYATYRTDTFKEYVAGEDFDVVVLATPVPCMPFIAPKLIERCERWRRMVHKVQACPTVSLQTWFTPTLKELGWTGPDSPLMSNYVEPLNTWSDMTQTIQMEDWPAGEAPGSVAYFTGPQPTPHILPPMPSDNPNYPEEMLAAAQKAGLELLEQHMKPLMPNAVDADGNFDWSLVVDPEDREGVARYAAQYVRTNCEPPEWCTLALPDTNQYRMKAGDTCFDNLVVTGDWIDNGFYVACLEGAVMGGIHSARAVSGKPIPIIGELIDDGFPSGRPWRLKGPPPAVECFAKDQKIKLAVLGAGLGSMGAVWAIMNSPEAHRFDITVYQYGWRIGGKGASGRNIDSHDQIEEHGLHIFGGMYENAFEIMREVYAQAGRTAGTPMSTWYDADDQAASAFWPHNAVSVADNFKDEWSFFNLLLPDNDELPGDGHLLDQPSAYLEMAIELIIELLGGASLVHRHDVKPPEGNGIFSRIAKGIAAFGDKVEEATVKAFTAIVGEGVPDQLRAGAADALGDNGDPGPLLKVLQAIRKALTLLLEKLLENHNEARWMIEGIDLAISVVTGVVEEQVLEKGFDVVDDQQFVDFLRKWGCTELTIDGLLVRGWHDFFFAFVDGDGSRRSLSASVALRTIFRYVFTYKTSFFWRMQASMGDTVFGPMYQVLVDKGVKFEFFHRVTDVSCAGESGLTDSVQTIHVDQQLALANDQDRYNPLYDVKGVPSWPNRPLWTQVEASDAIKAEPWRLESSWGNLTPVAQKVLKRGRDFDLVILGMSSKPLATLAKDLCEQSPALAAAAGLDTNQTIAAQLWLDKTVEEMGWNAATLTTGTSYADPHQTWAVMNELIEKESWEDASVKPKSLVYLTGTYTDAVPIPPTSDGQFPIENHQRVYDLTATWLEANWGALYPDGTEPESPSIDWALLVGSTAQGENRLRSQFWRGNIDPSERYVLSVPNTGSARVYSHQIGFDNAFGAGDWLYTGMNCGCVEGAIMGGLQAARAICGYPTYIPGNDERVFVKPEDVWAQDHSL